MIWFGMGQVLVIVTTITVAAAVSGDGMQCKDQHGQPVDWYDTRIKNKYPQLPYSSALG